MSKQDIDNFIGHIEKPWQQEACHRLLRCTLAADQSFEMSIKWQNPYFSINGKAAIKWFVAKEWINIYFYRGNELTDPSGLFEPTDNVSMRVIKIREHTRLDDPAFVNLVHGVIALYP